MPPALRAATSARRRRPAATRHCRRATPARPPDRCSQPLLCAVVGLTLSHRRPPPIVSLRTCSQSPIDVFARAVIAVTNRHTKPTLSCVDRFFIRSMPARLPSPRRHLHPIAARRADQCPFTPRIHATTMDIITSSADDICRRIGALSPTRRSRLLCVLIVFTSLRKYLSSGEHSLCSAQKSMSAAVSFTVHTTLCESES